MWSAVWAGRIEQTGQLRTNKVALSGRVFFKELRKLGEIVKVFQITEELDKNLMERWTQIYSVQSKHDKRVSEGEKTAGRC